MTKSATARSASPARARKGKAQAEAAAPQTTAPVAPASTAKTPAKSVAQDTITGIELARKNVTAKVESGVGVTLHTSGKPIKGLAAEPVVARPQRKMLRVIDKINGHPGKGNCVKRFHLYKEGMTLLHAKVTEGLIPSDITFYAELGYLTLREPTDEEYNAAVAAWEAKAKEVAAEQGAKAA